MSKKYIIGFDFDTILADYEHPISSILRWHKEEAVDALREIYKVVKHPLIVFSARTKVLEGKTKHWLEEQLEVPFELIMTYEKGIRAKELGLVCVVEDQPWFIQDLADNGIFVLIISDLWNVGCNPPYSSRVNNWRQIVAYVEMILKLRGEG